MKKRLAQSAFVVLGAALGVLAGTYGRHLLAASVERQAQGGLPASGADAPARLAASPRRSQWVMIPTAAGDSIRSWIVYPQRTTKAPVILVVHEIYGLTPWIRGVADQLAAEGFIAIAPDLLTSKHLAGTPDDGPASGNASAAIRTITPDVYQAQLEMIAKYGMALPTAAQRYGIVGYCWGGGAVYSHVVRAPANLGAGVAYYPGSKPTNAELASIKVPVLGNYGGNDARITLTAPALDSAMRAAGKSFEYHVYDGAAHGFLRAQEAGGGPNLTASKAAWPLTVAFFKKNLEQ